MVETRMVIRSRNRSDNESGVEFQHFCFEAFKYVQYYLHYQLGLYVKAGYRNLDRYSFFKWTKVIDFEEKVVRRSKHKLNVLTFFASYSY